MKPRSLSVFLISFALLTAVFTQSARAQAEANGPDVSPADATRNALLASLSRQLTGHFSADGELQLEPLRPWSLPVSAASSSAGTSGEWTATLIDFPTSLASSLLLRIRITDSQKTVREESLLCRAQLWRDAWVMQTPSERGGAFDPSRCDIRRIDALREREAIPASFVNTTDWSFLRPVPAGRLLTWRDLARRALVRKGDVIDVSALEGALQVTLKAMAMQDGGKGETVRVRNLESRREFAALVVSENHAQVRF